MIAENVMHYDHNLQLRQFPRLIPKLAPDWLQVQIPYDPFFINKALEY
jgi:hypothetical protein